MKLKTRKKILSINLSDDELALKVGQFVLRHVGKVVESNSFTHDLESATFHILTEDEYKELTNGKREERAVYNTNDADERWY